MDVTKEDAWETTGLEVPALFPDPGAPTGTTVNFQVKRDIEVPDSYESLDAAVVTVGSKPAIALDIKAGTLSVPRWVLRPVETVFPSSVSKATDAKSFSEVEWGIGERRISEAVSGLKIIKALKSKHLLLCSGSSLLAELLDLLLGGGHARNATGRRLLSQSNLDCGTLSSKRLCIVGQPPPNWGAGERAVLVAAHWTPRFAAGSAMLVCAPLGPLLKRVTNGAASSPDPAAAQVIATVLGAGVGCAIVILLVVLAVYLRMRKSSKESAVA